MSNIVRAVFGGSKTTRTRRLWKIDKGMQLQFVDLNLPTAYQVHFANTPASGQAKVVTATSDTVEIPYEYLQTGADVYAWVYLTPESGVGYTEYMVTIPVYARPDVTDEEPTPAQQSALDTAISALNSGVESVQAAVAGVQDSIDTALQEAKDSGEFDGADGYTPVKGVDYFDGERGEKGEKGDTGATGAKGDKGDKGETGADGYSPAATVTQTATGATVTVTDKTGTTTAQISNGAPGSPGNDGVSPTISVIDITGGHRVTITDATGQHSFDVMDGESGAGAVQDVQVAGVSVLSDGVANVPLAAQGKLGVIQLNSFYGIAAAGNGFVTINKADSNMTKVGTDNNRPIVPSTQHESTFYGLAKAAGSDEKNSTLPVGQYTDEAKIAIQKMLGVYREWELIADVTIDEDTAQISIDTDISDQPFALSRMLVRAWLQPATTGTNSYMSANCLVVSANDINAVSGAPTKRYMANGANTFFEYTAEIMGDVCYCTGAATSVPNSTSTVDKISSTSVIKHIRGFRMGRYGNDGSLVPSGSNIKVYGIRV